MTGFAVRIRMFFWSIRISCARWRTFRAIVKKRPALLSKISTGGIEILSYQFNGMPTGRTIAFPPMGIAGIAAGIDDQLGRLRMGEDYRNVPPVEGENGLDR